MRISKQLTENDKIRTINKEKQAEIDWITETKKENIVFGIGEVDVTEVREYFRTHLDENGIPYSFTGYLGYVLAQAVSKHPHVNSYMYGKNKIIQFEDVDIVCIVVRDFSEYDRPVPTAYTIRAAQTKYWKEIHKEIREAQTLKSKGIQYNKKGEKQARIVKLFTKMPSWMRRLVLRIVLRNPYNKKKLNGTIGLTSVGMFLDEGGNPISFSPHTVQLQVGGTQFKPRIINGELKNREFLSACIGADHAIIDGADITRFINTFRNLLQEGIGIDFSEPVNISQ